MWKKEPETHGTKHEGPPPKPASPPPKPAGLSELLAELDAHLREHPDRRALSVVALGAVLHMAIEAGWHEQELASLRAWPK